MNTAFKRICALFFAVLACMLCLTGCHGTKGLPVFVMPEEFDTSRQYEITFWAKNDTNVNQVKTYKKAIEEFQAIYPNITVNLRLYTDYARIYNDVITNISTNTTPNVCITYPDHIATYKTGVNVVVPLDEIISNPKYGLAGSELKFDAPAEDELISKFMEECVIDGQYYALPFMRSTEACYINKTYVEKLGYTVPDVLTWDFIWEVAEAATAKDEDGNFVVNGQKVLIPFIYKSTDNMMIQMLQQLGSGYSTQQGDILLFNDETAGQLYTIAEHAGTGAFSTFKISSYPANYLNAGQCIFAIDSTAGSTWMGTEAPLSDISEEALVQFETAVRMIPQFNTQSPAMISQGPSVCIFNKADPQEVLASWLFAQYLLTNGVQISYAQTEGYAPVTTKAQNSPEYADYLSRGGEDNDFYYNVKLQATQLLLNNIDNTFVTPVFNGSASLRDAAGQMIENTTKAMRRKQTVDDEFMANLFDDMKALYHLDQGESSLSVGKEEMGALPGAAVALLWALGGAWLLILLYITIHVLKKKKK